VELKTTAIKHGLLGQAGLSDIVAYTYWKIVSVEEDCLHEQVSVEECPFGDHQTHHLFLFVEDALLKH
jgi:hypothetical protein